MAQDARHWSNCPGGRSMQALQLGTGISNAVSDCTTRTSFHSGAECRRHVKADPLAAGRFPAAVATPPTVWRLCCRRFVVSRRGRGGVRCRPNVSGSWSCGEEGGASSPRPARSACLGPPPTTGRAATRRTAMARSWASCRRWSDWPCDGSARGSCRRRNGSRSPTFATPG